MNDWIYSVSHDPANELPVNLVNSLGTFSMWLIIKQARPTWVEPTTREDQICLKADVTSAGIPPLASLIWKLCFSTPWKLGSSSIIRAFLIGLALPIIVLGCSAEEWEYYAFFFCFVIVFYHWASSTIDIRSRNSRNQNFSGDSRIIIRKVFIIASCNWEFPILISKSVARLKNQ